MRRCAAFVIGLLCLLGCLLFVDAHAQNSNTAVTDIAQEDSRVENPSYE